MQKLQDKLAAKTSEEIIVKEHSFHLQLAEIRDRYENVIKQKDIQLIRIQYEKDHLRKEVERLSQKIELFQEHLVSS